jgi:N-acetylglutamate synthase-like GNAT family acetyltransferase
MDCIIREKNNGDSSWINEKLKENWGSSIIVSRRKKHEQSDLCGFVIENNKKKLGICLYRIENNECEMVVLEAFERKKGIGTALLSKLIENCSIDRIKRIWLITTNDNIDALLYYQKHGFEFVCIYRNEIDYSRRIKPEIPILGNYGIMIKDEIEMEKVW